MGFYYNDTGSNFTGYRPGRIPGLPGAAGSSAFNDPGSGGQAVSPYPPVPHITGGVQTPASRQGSFPTSGNQPSAPPPDFSNLDFSHDPILQRMQALTQQQISEAEADALASRRQLAIGYGDPTLAQQLGLGSDVIGQAKNNPFGTVQELGRTYNRRNVFDINRPLSDQHNLYYSSERARQLALSGEQNLRDRATAQNSIQAQLAEISKAVAQAKLSAQAQLIQAEQDAYQRAVQQAMYAAGVG